MADAVAGIFICSFKEQSVLLGKRGQMGEPDLDDGTWDYFGGGISSSEDPQKGAEREKEEELRDYFNNDIYYKKTLINTESRKSRSSSKSYIIYHYVYMVENESTVPINKFPYNLLSDIEGSSEVIDVKWFPLSTIKNKYDIFPKLHQELVNGLADKIIEHTKHSPPSTTQLSQAESILRIMKIYKEKIRNG